MSTGTGKLIAGKNQDLNKQLKIISNQDKLNECYERQNGKCMFEGCKQSIYAMLNAKAQFTNETRFLGICERHFEENVKQQNKKDNILGIKRF